jgi:NAD(P)-dependent dehydrogenase (short-subunit alcohol dehydrogenase family)
MRALEGQHAVVTGGGRGIGAAIATALAQQGATLTLMGRDAQRLEAQARDMRVITRARPIVVDVKDAASVEAGFSGAVDAAGPINILINNAGAVTTASFGKTDANLWNDMLAVNLTGTYLCSQQVISGMLQRGYGRVVNIASTAGLTGYAYVTAYCAAKHGVVGLTRALAMETARKNITVNAVCPGYTETDIVRDAVINIVAKTGKTEDEARAALTSRNPQQRLVQPEEVANAVLWLCLPGSEAITGQTIAVAGGELL